MRKRACVVGIAMLALALVGCDTANSAKSPPPMPTPTLSGAGDPAMEVIGVSNNFEWNDSSELFDALEKEMNDLLSNINGSGTE